MASVLQENFHVKRRALVVDDSNIARHVLADLLFRIGFDVEVADSAENALRQLTGPLPDVVFMDHLLPGMDGLEAVRRLRAQRHTARTPIVMYTSQDTAEFADRAQLAGADGVYCKASEQTQLTDILRRLNLISAETVGTSEAAKVLPFRDDVLDQQYPGIPDESSAATQASLIEPLLQTYHEKLHQDLLAEFAILERYEERMRRDMFAKVDTLTNSTIQRVDQYFGARRTERKRQTQANRWRGWAIAAAILLAFGINLGTGRVLEQQTRALETQGTSLLASVGAQSRALDDVRVSVLALQQASAFRETYPTIKTAAVSSTTTERPVRDPDAYPPNRPAAVALVEEIQSMGILGPVLIETLAGSFCIVSTPSGFELDTGNLSLGDCESLPVRMTAANW